MGSMVGTTRGSGAMSGRSMDLALEWMKLHSSRKVSMSAHNMRHNVETLIRVQSASRRISRPLWNAAVDSARPSLFESHELIAAVGFLLYINRLFSLLFCRMMWFCHFCPRLSWVREYEHVL